MSSMYERCSKVMPAVANRATTLGIVDGEGCYVYTEDGRRILDFASGVAVNNLGNKNPEVVEAIPGTIGHYDPRGAQCGLQ